MAYDMVISGARVIDPETGRDAVLQVGIEGGSIAAVSRNDLSGKTEIDGRGLVLAPGFIDIHTHEDITEEKREAFRIPRQTAACALRTGNTLILGGNCGGSNYPVGKYLAALKQAALPISCPTLVGGTTLRSSLGLGNYDRADAAEISRLKDLAAAALDEGAAGISLGLQYAPGTGFDELLALAQTAAEKNKFFAVHMRYDTPLKAALTLEEVIAAAKTAGAPLEISHLAANVYGKDAAGNDNIRVAADMIQAARREGADILADVYPYDTWATSIKSAVFDKGFDEFNFNAADLEILSGDRAGQFCTEELFEELRRAEEDTSVACHNAIPAGDIEEAYTLEFTCVGSDAVISTGGGHIKGHPRSSSSPARFLREFVREKKLFPLIEGIRKLTLIPASRLGLEKKGRLQEGCDADMVLFDFEAITDRAGFGVDICALPPLGIKQVFSGGALVYSASKT
ncbi:MAG: amidohydrolase family protein [Spirochaetaceae bacterium]|jgi:N-acyl-D-amino-acid deacylase|nr:amidohydrolase family protein [Spirochaetaceae bacterium]